MFVNRLEEAVSDGRAFSLVNCVKGLTADIITQFTIEWELQAQSTPEDKGEKGLFGILMVSHQLLELSFRDG